MGDGRIRVGRPLARVGLAYLAIWTIRPSEWTTDDRLRSGDAREPMVDGVDRSAEWYDGPTDDNRDGSRRWNGCYRVIDAAERFNHDSTT